LTNINGETAFSPKKPGQAPPEIITPKGVKRDNLLFFIGFFLFIASKASFRGNDRHSPARRKIIQLFQ